MELFVTTLLNDNYVEKKCSLFGDEEIELTWNWNDQQVLTGYGSFSKTFSLPIDSNNSEIFKYYDVINASLNLTPVSGFKNAIDPNYFLPARLIIQEFEMIGNIQVVSFSTKGGFHYSYNVNFYGTEKNLIKTLNSSLLNKIADLDISGATFTFNFENVVSSWTGSNTFHFTPLMTINRPFNYRDTVQQNNINSSLGSTTGISMTDLCVGYNFKQILDRMFKTHNINLQHSTKITDFLKELYIFPNNKIEFGSGLLYIYTQSTETKLFEWSYYDIIMNQLPITPYLDTDGFLAGTTDSASYDTTYNYYTAPSTGNFVLNYSYNITPNVSQSGFFSSIVILVRDYTNGDLIQSSEYVTNSGNYSVNLALNSGQKIHILAYYKYFNADLQVNENKFFLYNELTTFIKIFKAKDTVYDYDKSTINFPDMFLSDFFTSWCKSFNIFFIYDDTKKLLKTYFKDELPKTIYDFSRYLLLDKDYLFNHQQKYKLIDYKFATPKDINNLAYKQAATTQGAGNTSFSLPDISGDLWYGENKTYYNYDVGIDKLEYNSIFTVFPRTTLNKTDNDNMVIEDTAIPLHSELDESYKALNTDFLLAYKMQIVTGLTHTYNLQSATGYTSMDYASDYGPTGPSGYTLNYKSFPNVIKDNVNKRYETELEFLLPTTLIFNLKVYDQIVVYGTWYEIVEISANIKTGYSKISLVTIPIPVVVPYSGQTTTTTTTTIYTGSTTSTTTTTLSGQTTTTTTLADPLLATLTFIDYSYSGFWWMLSDPIYSTDVVITGITIDGYTNNSCNTLTGNKATTSMTIAKGYVSNTSYEAFNDEYYKKVNSVNVNGSTLQNGDTIMIGGTLVTISIDYQYCYSVS